MLVWKSGGLWKKKFSIKTKCGHAIYVNVPTQKCLFNY